MKNTESMVEPFVEEFVVAVSHSVGLPAGCCLLIRKSLGVIDQNVVSSQEGKFVVCDFIYCKVNFRVLCLYAPTKPGARQIFFESIANYF